MFTKQELQVIAQTLVQKRDWITKNINNAEGSAKTNLEQNLHTIESVLHKISAQLRSTTNEKTTVNHYISEKAISPIRQAALAHRNDLAPGQIRVLLVDDDQLICELITAYLHETGIHLVDVASDGMQGISMMYEANPVYDLVLCDWNMPGKSGLEVHNAMRAAERYIATVFILVTAVSEAKQIRSAIEEGIDDYVIKPVERDKLFKKIARFFPHVKAPE